jgi:hypothetical protein
LKGKGEKFGHDALCNGSTFFFSEKLVAKLDNIIAVRVADQLIDFEVDYMNKAFSELVCESLTVITFELGYSLYHLLDNAHGMLVKCKEEKIFSNSLHESTGLLQGEQGDDFLKEVGGVRVLGQRGHAIFNGISNQFVLLVCGEESDESLQRVSSLFVTSNSRDITLNSLHNSDPLGQGTNPYQFLNHVVCVLVRD